MHTDSFVLSIISSNIIRDLKNLEILFDFSSLNNNHELFRNKNKKFFVNLKQKLVQIFLWISL